MRALATLTGASVLILAQSAPASAAKQVRCTIRSILGRHAKGPTDRRLAFLKRQLSRPPFSTFKSFQLLDVKTMRIPRGAVRAARLPTKKIARLTFKGLVKAKRGTRLRMHLSITPPRALGFLPGTQFTIANGGTLLIGGARFAGGTLVVSVTCRK